MIQAEVYDRIELIYKLLQDKKTAISECCVDLLYEELEILCEVIQEDKK